MQADERTLGRFIHQVTASEKLVNRLSHRKRIEQLFSPFPSFPLLPSLLNDDQACLYHH